MEVPLLPLLPALPPAPHSPFEAPKLHSGKLDTRVLAPVLDLIEPPKPDDITPNIRKSEGQRARRRHPIILHPAIMRAAGRPAAELRRITPDRAATDSQRHTGNTFKLKAAHWQRPERRAQGYGAGGGAGASPSRNLPRHRSKPAGGWAAPPASLPRLPRRPQAASRFKQNPFKIPTKPSLLSPPPDLTSRSRTCPPPPRRTPHKI